MELGPNHSRGNPRHAPIIFALGAEKQKGGHKARPYNATAIANRKSQIGNLQ
ncbi:hypothetical protein SBA2_680040 [Acidobacteriia bacterium SbA2]|nr:hypothetical protein SBA2_680040 [Acidobacteriia bacterium SbA2]